MNERLISGTVRVVAFAAAMLLLTVLVVTRSQAAFTATTANPPGTVQTGGVALTDNDSGTAMFNVTGLAPNTWVTRCINVTYSGSLTPAPVKLYGTGGGALAQYLDMTIEAGSGGTFPGCGGFSPTGGTVFTGTLASFASSHTNWADGAAAFTAAANPTTTAFRVSVKVQDTNAAQNLTATFGFTWETQV